MPLPPGPFSAISDVSTNCKMTRQEDVLKNDWRPCLHQEASPYFPYFSHPKEKRVSAGRKKKGKRPCETFMGRGFFSVKMLGTVPRL